MVKRVAIPLLLLLLLLACCASVFLFTQDNTLFNPSVPHVPDPVTPTMQMQLCTIVLDKCGQMTHDTRLQSAVVVVAVVA